MKKIKFKVRAPRRRNPVALPARRRRAGPHRNRRKEYQAGEKWWEEMFDERE